MSGTGHQIICCMLDAPWRSNTHTYTHLSVFAQHEWYRSPDDMLHAWRSNTHTYTHTHTHTHYWSSEGAAKFISSLNTHPSQFHSDLWPPMSHLLQVMKGLLHPQSTSPSPHLTHTHTHTPHHSLLPHSPLLPSTHSRRGLSLCFCTFSACFEPSLRAHSRQHARTRSNLASLTRSQDLQPPTGQSNLIWAWYTGWTNLSS